MANKNNLYEENLDKITDVLAQHDLTHQPNGSKLISLLIALPQCVQLIREAQFRITKSRRDIGFILDASVELVGAIAERIPESDFNKLKEALGEINIQFTAVESKDRET